MTKKEIIRLYLKDLREGVKGDILQKRVKVLKSELKSELSDEKEIKRQVAEVADHMVKDKWLTFCDNQKANKYHRKLNAIARS